MVWITTLALIALGFIGIFAIGQGWLGKLPPISELQNPINKYASRVYSDDGVLMGTWSYASENRVMVPYDSLPANLVNALVATEDSRFFEHSGIDMRAFFRAVVKRGFMGQKSAGGGSTITQQLAKQLYSDVNVHTTVMDWNRDEICDVIDFAVEKGAMAAYLFFLIPVGRGVFIEDSALEVQAYEELLQRIMLKQKEIPIPIKPTCAPQFTRVAKQLGVTLDRRFTRGCLAGLTYCIVSPVGMVRPCAYMTEEAGSIREKPFDEIWRSSELFASLRTRNYGGYCSACGYQDICGGCRARAAYYHNGDYMAADSYCAYGLRMQEA